MELLRIVLFLHGADKHVAALSSSVRLCRVHGPGGCGGLQWGSHHLRQALRPVEPGRHPLHHAERLPALRGPLRRRLRLGFRRTLPHLPGADLSGLGVSFFLFFKATLFEPGQEGADHTFSFAEYSVWEYPGREIRVSRERLGAHLCKCQRSNIQTSCSGCQKPSEC